MPVDLDKEEGDNSAAIAGGVGGVMFLIIVGQSVAIVVLLLRQRTINRARYTKQDQHLSGSCNSVLNSYSLCLTDAEACF